MEDKKPVKLKYAVPKSIGGAIDLLYKVRDGRKAFTAKAEAEKQQEGLIEGKILEMFKKSELEGAQGKVAQSSIKLSEVPTIEDWEKFEKHLKKSGELDLMQRRLSVEACRERWKDKKTIPGVTVFTKVGLTLTKRKAK